MCVTELLISSVKKGFFAQKRPNLAQNWHFWSIWARPCRLIRCPVGGSVGGCGARAVSHKTHIYFIFFTLVFQTFNSEKMCLNSANFCGYSFKQYRDQIAIFEKTSKYVPK